MARRSKRYAAVRHDQLKIDRARSRALRTALTVGGKSAYKRIGIDVDVTRERTKKDELVFAATACVRSKGKVLNPKRCAFGESPTSPTRALQTAVKRLATKIK